jgi:hypothetical protein
MATSEHETVYFHVPVGSPPQGETVRQVSPLVLPPQLDAAATQSTASHPQRDPFALVILESLERVSRT